MKRSFMKKLMLLAALSVSSAALGVANLDKVESFAEFAENPYLYYTFDEEDILSFDTVANKGVGGADKVITLGKKAKIADGTADTVDGDGVHDGNGEAYVRLPSDMFSHTAENGAFTLTFDFKHSYVSGDGNSALLFQFFSEEYEIGTEVGHSATAVGDYAYMAGLNNPNYLSMFTFTAGKDNTAKNRQLGDWHATDKTNFKEKTWQRAILLFDGSKISFSVYCDGALVKSVSGATTAEDLNLSRYTQLLLGYDRFNRGCWKRGLSGEIDNIVYFDNAISKNTEKALIDGTWFEDGIYEDIECDFTSDCDYRIQEPVYGVSDTFEAVIKYPAVKFRAKTGGCIFGTFDLGNTRYGTNYEVNIKGNPVVRWNNDQIVVTFDQIDLRTDEWTHLAIVRNEKNNTFSAYVNGILKQTATGAGKRVSPLIAPVIGNDARDRGEEDNAFKGSIRKIAIYSETRTAAQISSDFKDMTPDVSDSRLIGFWDLTDLPLRAEDLSGRGNTAVRTSRSTYIDGEFAVYDYTFALLPDTQYLSRYAEGDLYALFDWIKDNAEDLKIKFLMSMGDMQDNADNLSGQWRLDEMLRQFSVVKAGYDRLNGKVPYSALLGEHDYDYGPGVLNRDTKCYNATFGQSDFACFYSAFDESVDNVAHKFTVGEQNWIVLALEMYPRDEVLCWAGEICENNPDCRIIVTTHSYLDEDGSPLDFEDEYPAFNDGISNGAEQLWEKLICKYTNIYMIASGHSGGEGLPVTMRIGNHGNEVIQIRCNAQYAMNNRQALVCLLSFKDNGRTVAVNYYSPTENKFFNYQNQFSFTVNAAQLPNGTIPDDEPKDSSTSAISSGSDRTDSQSGTEENKKGCGSSFAAMGAIIPFAVAGCFVAKRKNRRK